MFKIIRILPFLFLIAGAVHAEVVIGDSGEIPAIPPKPEGFRERNVSLNTGKIAYTLKDWCHTGKEGTVYYGLGMSGPSYGNWYPAGFITLTLNNKKIIPLSFPTIKIIEQGERGVVDFIYDEATAEIRARFLALKDDDKLFLSLDIQPKENLKINSMEIGLMCGQFGPVSSNNVITVKGPRYPESGEGLGVNCSDNPDEFWVVYNTGEVGPCGLLFLPEELLNCAVKRAGNFMGTKLGVKSDKRRIHLVLFDMPKMRTADMVNYMAKEGAPIRETLSKMNFLPLNIQGFKADLEDSFIKNIPIKLEPKQQAIKGQLDMVKSCVSNFSSANENNFIDTELKAFAELGKYQVSKVGIQKRSKPAIDVLHLKGLYNKLYKIDEAFNLLGDKKGTLDGSTYNVYWAGEFLTYLPQTEEEIIRKYDVVVLNNVSYESIKKGGDILLESFVRHGGGLLIIGGRCSFGEGSFKDTNTAKVLPVEITGPFDMVWHKPAGKIKKASNHPVLAGINFDARLVCIWQHKLEAKENAEVILTCKDMPLLVLGTYGEGRVAALTGTCLGVPADKEIPFWEWPEWPKLMSNVLIWLKGGDR